MPQPLPHAVPLSEVVAALNADVEHGLTNSEAARRRQQFGPNMLAESGSFTWVGSVVRSLTSPIILVLLVAFVVTILLHELIESLVIGFSIALNTVLELVQELRANRAISSLKSLQSHQARVYRDSREVLIDASELVVGDVVVFESGDKIAADGRLLEETDLRINESLLTGETALVGKHVEAVAADALPADQKNMVFSGSLVVIGHGVMLVTAIGGQTQLGHIAEEVAGHNDRRSLLEQRLSQLVKVVGLAVPALVVVVFIMGWLRGENFADLFLFCVSLVVSVIPEGLALGVTTALAVAAWRMAQQGALLRNLSSAETLGSTTVLAVDKTGTLTKNELSVERLYCLGGEMERKPGTHEWEVVADIDHPGDRDQVVDQAEKIALVGALCNTSQLIEDVQGVRQILGDPLEGALKILAEEQRLSLLDLQEHYPKTGEVPFSSQSRYMLTIHRHRKKSIVAVKGAPAEILAGSTHEWVNGKPVKLNQATRQQWLDLAAREAATGLRVLAFAYREAEGELSPDQASANWSFLGLVGLDDPLQDGVVDSIAELQHAGVRLLMITGDHALTAQSIAKSLGLPHRDVVTGHDVSHLSDHELYDRLKATSVCARVAPEQKQRIVEVLQLHGEVVSMTGDGVNDAPALVTADIGVAMGKGGTDVARDAADIVLLQNQFSAMVQAVYQGRGLVLNVRKMITFLLSSNASGLLLVMLSFLLGLPSPALASQILWVNLVIDGLPDTAIIFEPLESSVATQKPDGKQLYLLNRPMILRIIYLGGWIGLCCLGVFIWSLGQGSQEYARTMAITALVVFQICNSFNCQSATASIAHTWLGNRMLLGSLAIGIVAHLLVMYTALGQLIFKFVPLDRSDWLIVLGLGLSLVVVEETRKWIVRSRATRSTIATTLAWKL